MGKIRKKKLTTKSKEIDQKHSKSSYLIKQDTEDISICCQGAQHRKHLFSPSICIHTH